MGLPEIIIEFKTKGVTAIKRSARGIVAIVLKDDTEEGQALNIYKSVLDVDPTHFTELCIRDRVAPSANAVASVTRGDTSISYRDKANSLKETVAFVKNYESQLIPFKRMKLPKDCPT